jgi:hypothetical protein
MRLQVRFCDQIPFAIPSLSIIRVFVPHVAYESVALSVPALEVPSREPSDGLRGFGVGRYRLNVLFSDISDGFVAHTATISTLLSDREGYDSQYVIERLIPTTRQAIHVHILDPILARVAADVPPRNHTFVVIPLVLEQLSDLEFHIPSLPVAYRDLLAHRIDLMHGLHEL